jgi:hypothetical protein
VSILVKAKGITKLSQLQIDVDKDWNGKGITNIKHIAEGMTKGHIVQHNGQVLETMPPEMANNVLTSAGPGQKVVWAPGGTYLDRFFPCEIVLNKYASRFTADELKFILALLTAPYGYTGVVGGSVNPSWFRNQTPLLGLARIGWGFLPNAGKNVNVTKTTQYDLEIPAGGAVADDSVTPVNETIQMKSGYTKYESNIFGDDNQKDIGSASIWEAQAFTPAVSHAIRFVWLKLYGTVTGMIITVSIKAVDGSGHPTGPDLCSANLSEINFASPGRYYKFTFSSPAQLSAGTQYALVVRHGGGFTLSWRCDASSPTYLGGKREYSSNAGTTWTSDVAADFLFEEWGTPAPDMTLLPAVPASGAAYYFGHARKFSFLITDIGQAGAGTYTVAWEYSKGAGVWGSCVDLMDGSNAFKNNWSQEVSHTPQVDWATDTVADIANLYWLRAKCIDVGSGYSQPKANYARVRITV